MSSWLIVIAEMAQKNEVVPRKALGLKCHTEVCPKAIKNMFEAILKPFHVEFW